MTVAKELMTLEPHSDWEHIGTSMNSDVYRMRDDVIVVIPHADTRETEETARSNLQVQAEFWKRQGHGGGAIILMDPILEQDAGARAVYANEAGEVGTTCFALVSESYFAMATSQVYTGLARPSVPIEVFRSLEDAISWIDETLAAAGSD